MYASCDVAATAGGKVFVAIFLLLSCDGGDGGCACTCSPGGMCTSRSKSVYTNLAFAFLGSRLARVGQPTPRNSLCWFATAVVFHARALSACVIFPNSSPPR